MGCWNKTCGLSNLPIFAGARVYVIPLQKNFDDTERCYSSALWFPTLVPFEADYDDYGGGENVSGIGAELLIAGLKKQLIEKTVGENEYHDIAVSRDGFDIDKFFESVHEGRLEVLDMYGKPQLVDYVMLRKDVVDYILHNYKIREYVGEGKGTTGRKKSYTVHTFADVEQNIPKWLEEFETTLNQLRPDSALRLMMTLGDAYHDDPISMLNSRRSVDGSYDTLVRVGEVFGEYFKDGNRTKMLELLQASAKGRYINRFVSETRKVWIPGCHEGSQADDPKPYELLCKAVRGAIKADASRFD